MIKKLILVTSIFLLCGCSDTSKVEMDYYVDEDTCVVYLARWRYGVVQNIMLIMEIEIKK